MSKVVDTKSGNPYHDEEGKFTSEGQEGSKKDEKEISINSENPENEDVNLDDVSDEYDDLEIEEEPEIEDVDLDDIGLDDLPDDDRFDDLEVRQNLAELSEEVINHIDSLSMGEVEESLINNFGDYFDKTKIFAASEEENLIEAYENNDFYIFMFRKEVDIYIDDAPAIAINKNDGSVKELYGQEMGIEINSKEAKEISLEEIEGLKLF